MSNIAAFLMGGPGGDSKYWPIVAALWIGFIYLLKRLFREQDVALRNQIRSNVPPAVNVTWVRWLIWVGTGIIAAFWLWDRHS